MAGSIALSLTQRYDKTSHLPLDGGKLYFYAAGTSTPQNAFQDISLTIPWPNPIELDSGGNVPQLFFADGYIKFRLANAAGVTQIAADYVLVLGPTTGEAAAPSIDATTVFGAGDLKPRYGTGVHSGWVRANGRTIGSASSGASERANTDCQELFEYLWGADANLSVSTGRGASANADWVANKTIALPDFRGRVPAGLGDMGNTDAGRLTLANFGASPIGLGLPGGGESVTLAANQIPSLTSSGSNAISVTTTINSLAYGFQRGDVLVNGGGGYFGAGSLGTMTIGTVPSTGNNSISVTYTNGSQQVTRTVQPTILITYYIKL